MNEDQQRGLWDCVLRAAAPPLSPELFEEVYVGAGADELDELLVGGRVGVGLLVVLADLLAVLQLGQQHAVDVVRVAQDLHHRLQH